VSSDSLRANAPYRRIGRQAEFGNGNTTNFVNMLANTVFRELVRAVSDDSAAIS
jgi:hypothetical protein